MALRQGVGGAQFVQRSENARISVSPQRFPGTANRDQETGADFRPCFCVDAHHVTECHCEPVTVSLVWQSVFLYLAAGSTDCHVAALLAMTQTGMVHNPRAGTSPAPTG